MVRNAIGEPWATHLRRNDCHRAELHASQCQVATWHVQMPVILPRMALRLTKAPRHEGWEKSVESRHAIGTLGSTGRKGRAPAGSDFRCSCTVFNRVCRRGLSDDTFPAMLSLDDGMLTELLLDPRMR